MADSLRPGFTSAKTSVPIPYRLRWHRDALLQLTLDARVKALNSHNDANNVLISVALTSGRIVTALLAENAQTDADDEGLILITRAIAYSEPRCTIAREIWAQRHLSVALGDRVRILLAVKSSEGRGVPLSSLATHVHTPEADPFAVVARLICDGVLSLDLEHPVSPATVIQGGALGDLGNPHSVLRSPPNA